MERAVNSLVLPSSAIVETAVCNDKAVSKSLSFISQIFSNEPKINAQTLNNKNEDVKNDNYFRCEICMIWFCDIDEFFLHILEEHQHIEISDDVQNILYTQWEKMLKMERTIMELVSKNRFKSAKRHLKSSLVTLNGIVTNVFASNDNIFKYFISTMRPRIKSLIKVAKSTNKDFLRKSNDEILTHHDGLKFNDYLLKIDSTKQKKKRKVSNLSVKKNNEVKSASEFSSDDDLCVKEAVKRMKTESTNSDNNSIDNLEVFDNILRKVTYYVIPEKSDGNKLNFREKNQVKIAIHDILKKKCINIDCFEAICLKKFDLEKDEVVPEDAYIIDEWILDGKKESYWEKMTIKEFFIKNNSKKHNVIDDSSCSYMKNSNTLLNIDCRNNVKINNSIKTLNDNRELQNDIRKRGDFMKCDMCPTTFFSHLHYKLHMLNIHHVSDVNCKICGEIFLCEDKFLKHISQCHPHNETCDVCPMKFVLKEEKDKHFNLHRLQNEWLCIICSQRFPNEDHLKKHCKLNRCPKLSNTIDEVVETNEKDVTFKTPGKVIKHNIKSEEAPECDKCFRKFTSLGRLLQHVAIAHEGKTFLRKNKKFISNV